MTSWGTPFLGTKTKVSGEHELKAGDHIILEMTKGSCTYFDEVYQNPQLAIDEIKSEFNAEGTFEPKFIGISFFPLPHNYFNVKVEVHAIVIHASPLVISVSWILLASLLVVLGIVIVVALIVYYLVEKVGGAGAIIILVLVAVIVIVIFMGVSRRGRAKT